MKPKKIDLNQWERVNFLDELDGYQSIIIIPIRLSDGTQPPSLYFRKGVKRFNEISDVSSVEWDKNIRISKDGTDEEYAQRVDWWYNCAINNAEYKEMINKSFNRYNFDIRKSWDMSQNYLKKFNYSAKKTYLHKYVWNWLTTDMHKWLKFRR